MLTTSQKNTYWISVQIQDIRSIITIWISKLKEASKNKDINIHLNSYYMKVLVLVDGSKHSLKALDYSIYLLKGFGASENMSKNNTKNKHELIILNVLPTIHTSTGVITPIKPTKDVKNISLDQYTNQVNEIIESEWVMKS